MLLRRAKARAGAHRAGCVCDLSTVLFEEACADFWALQVQARCVMPTLHWNLGVHMSCQREIERGTASNLSQRQRSGLVSALLAGAGIRAVQDLAMQRDHEVVQNSVYTRSDSLGKN